MENDSNDPAYCASIASTTNQQHFHFDTLNLPSEGPVLDLPTKPVEAAPGSKNLSSGSTWKNAVGSTLASLTIVLILLTAVRFFLPPLLETSRYSWYRGQLRAEHEAAGERLKNISLNGLSEVSAMVSQRVTPSVVHIDVRQKNAGWTLSNDQVSESSKLDRQFVLGQGSGVVVDASGFLLTNYHVVENADLIEVYLGDRRRLRATLIGSDRATDLAVLKVDANDLIPIEWGDSEQLTVGTPVWAVGSPFGLSGSITFGIISSKHRVDLSGTRYGDGKVLTPRYGDLLQSDVAVNPGNSGGPLVDASGSLVGINTAILGEDYRGVSFSIPSRVVRRCYEQILKYGEVNRGWLGVELQMVADKSLVTPNATLNIESDSDELPRTGALVLRFAGNNNSPALRAGIRIGDRIVEFNGVQIQDADELIRTIGETDSGSPIPFKVIRDGETIALKVKLGVRPPE